MHRRSQCAQGAGLSTSSICFPVADCRCAPSRSDQHQWRRASTCQEDAQAVKAIKSIRCMRCVVGMELPVSIISPTTAFQAYLTHKSWRQLFIQEISRRAERDREGATNRFCLSYSFRFFAFWSQLCTFRARLAGFRAIVEGSISYHRGEQENLSYSDSQSFWCTKYSLTIVEFAT